MTRAHRDPIEAQMLSVPTDPAAWERLAKAGVRRANHRLPSGSRSMIEQALEQWGAAIGWFTGG